MKTNKGLLLGAAAFLGMAGLAYGVSSSAPAEAAGAIDAAEGETRLVKVTGEGDLADGDLIALACPAYNAVMGDSEGTGVNAEGLKEETVSFLYEDGFCLFEVGISNQELYLKPSDQEGFYLSGDFYSRGLIATPEETLWNLTFSNDGEATLFWTQHALTLSYADGSFILDDGPSAAICIYKVAGDGDVFPYVSLTADGDWVSIGSNTRVGLEAEAFNFEGEVTFEWFVDEDSMELALVEWEEGASATVDALTNENGTAKIYVVAYSGDMSYCASAFSTVEVKRTYEVEEALADPSLLDGDILIDGYIVTEDAGDGTYTSFEIGDADIDETPLNGYNTIRLYDDTYGEAQVGFGEYVIIRGTFACIDGVYQIGPGYEVLRGRYGEDYFASTVLGSDSDGQCHFKYWIAKAAYVNMDEQTKWGLDYMRDYNATVAAVLDRYEAWARAVGDSDPYGTGDSSAIFGIFSDGDSMAYAVAAVTTILALSLAGIGVYLTFKKRKQA